MRTYLKKNISLILLMTCAFAPALRAKVKNEGRPPIDTVLKRIVMAQAFYNKNWTLSEETPKSIGKTLAQFKPTYVSGLIYFNERSTITEKQMQAYSQIQKIVRASRADCQFDVMINPNQYKQPEDIIARMQAIHDQFDIDIWYLDFSEDQYKASGKVVEAAINFARQHDQLIGGNDLDKDLLKSGDFVAYHDGMEIDLKLKDDIKDTAEKFPARIVFQLNNDSNRSTDDTVHTFMKKWKTYERERHVKRLARNQDSWNYRLMYPVFFPVYLKQNAYNAAKDGEILEVYQELMNLYNE